MSLGLVSGHENENRGAPWLCGGGSWARMAVGWLVECSDCFRWYNTEFQEDIVFFAMVKKKSQDCDVAATAI